MSRMPLNLITLHERDELKKPNKLCRKWWKNSPSFNHESGIYCQSETCLSRLQKTPKTKTKVKHPMKDPTVSSMPTSPKPCSAHFKTTKTI